MLVKSELINFLASSSFLEWEKLNSLIFWRVHRGLAVKSWICQKLEFGQFNRSPFFYKAF